VFALSADQSRDFKNPDPSECDLGMLIEEKLILLVDLVVGVDIEIVN